MIFHLLHAFSRWLEDAAGRHTHTIALLEAISTTAAVIVAMWVSYAAKRANRPRLRASVQVMQVIYGDGRPIEDAPTYVAARLTNVGPVPVRLHSNLFSYHLAFTKNPWWLVMPVDEPGDGHVTRRQYPFVLLPHTSETIFLTEIERFRSDMPRILDSGWFGRKIATRLLRGTIFADGAGQFRADLRGLRKELEKAGRGEGHRIGESLSGGQDSICLSASALYAATSRSQTSWVRP